MNNQKLAIKVRLNQQKARDGKLPVYIRIYVDGVKAEISSRHFVEAVHWDAKKSRVKALSKDAAYINGYIDRTVNLSTRSF